MAAGGVGNKYLAYNAKKAQGLQCVALLITHIHGVYHSLISLNFICIDQIAPVHALAPTTRPSALLSFMYTEAYDDELLLSLLSLDTIFTSPLAQQSVA